MASLLIIPGLWNSGPQHWQSIWETQLQGCKRVEQRDWQNPDCSDWVDTLQQFVCSAPSPVVLVAHSLGCATIAHWAERKIDGNNRVAAAFLVAPSDVDASTYPPGTTGFTPMPLKAFPFQSLLVASSDDPYVTVERASMFAESWSSRMVVLHGAGHINAASGYGPWLEGQELLKELIIAAESPKHPASYGVPAS